jgi:hypothetical protein
MSIVIFYFYKTWQLRDRQLRIIMPWGFKGRDAASSVMAEACLERQDSAIFHRNVITLDGRTRKITAARCHTSVTFASTSCNKPPLKRPPAQDAKLKFET